MDLSVSPAGMHAGLLAGNWEIMQKFGNTDFVTDILSEIDILRYFDRN